MEEKWGNFSIIKNNDKIERTDLENLIKLIEISSTLESNSFLLDEQHTSGPALPPPAAVQRRDPDVIDAEYREVTPQALPGGAYPATGYQHMQSLDDMFNQTSQKRAVPVPVGKLH